MFDKVKVVLDRDSVCAGDDCVSHSIKQKFPANMITSELLIYLGNEYVPTIQKGNVIWAVFTSNLCTGFVGYIVVDENQEITVELEAEDTVITELFDRKAFRKTVFCRYYHSGNFTWRDSKTGDLIEKHKECKSLLEKVKRDRML